MDAGAKSRRPLSAHRLSRRQVLFDLGWGGVAVAVLSACTGSGSPPAPAVSTGASTGASAAAPTAPPTSALTWQRANLGFVSAYVMLRGGQAAVVDTGVNGSADEIGKALSAAGASWDTVSDVLLTHYHSDHAGSVDEVVARAAQATVHAGAEDIARIPSPRSIVAAADGSDVFGLQVVATPGHTEGHISVFDRATKVLVVGDALGNTTGLTGSNPQFTADNAKAKASVTKLAALGPDTILFGHGEPLTTSAAQALRDYAGKQ